MTRWQRYWFDDGGRTSVAIIRIAIATSVLWTLHRLATLSTVHIPAPSSVYRPVGLWMLFGSMVPPAPLVWALWAIAVGATVLMLIGLASRAATALSFVAAVALTSASFSGSATWSHQYNVVFLAQLALLGARCGDTLSLDAWIRRRRGLPPIDVPRGYQWSVRLVQLAVALMFAGAAFHKYIQSPITLRWALSDNLRHQLLVRFDLAGLPRPAVASWLLEDVWRYRTAATLNLISQAAPIFACVFVRRPWVRAFAGGFFVIETVALGLVVNLWNTHWLPLAAVFVDWERVRARVLGAPAAAPSAPQGWAPPRAARRFILGFVTYDLLIAFIPTIDQRLNTYPFSSFPMFSTVRARAPYGEHQPYTLPGDLFEVISDRPLDGHAQRWVDHMNRRLHAVTDPAKYEKRLAVILADIQARFSEFGIRGVRHWLAIFEAPAYPAPAQLIPHKIAVMGELEVGGRYRSALGAIDGGGVTPRPRALELGSARWLAYVGDRPAPQELAATRDGERFTVPALPDPPLYVVAVIDGTPWLVAGKRPRWE